MEEKGAYYSLDTGELLLINESEKHRELWEQLVLILINDYGDIGQYFSKTGKHFKYDFDYDF